MLIYVIVRRCEYLGLGTLGDSSRAHTTAVFDKIIFGNVRDLE